MAAKDETMSGQQAAVPYPNVHAIEVPASLQARNLTPTQVSRLLLLLRAVRRR